MPIKYVPFIPEPVEGQAVLGNFSRILKYKGADDTSMVLQRGMPLYEMEKQETVGENKEGNLVIRGECVSACAYLKEQGIQVDLVYIDPPFASGADYAKKVVLRPNPLAPASAAEVESPDADFEEKMYGDIWEKEKYLNWMYDNLMAIKSVMAENASIYVHLDWHIGHYVKVMLDEVFGEDNFVDEVIWCYGSPSGGRSKGAKFVKNHDSILHYAKNYDTRTENKLYIPYDEKYINDWFKYTDEKGRRYQKRMRKDENGQTIWERQYLDESKGIPLSTVWTDIKTVYADPRAYKRGNSTVPNELDWN